MRRTSQVYKKILTEVPNDIRIRVNLSFDIADKIVALLEEQGLSQRELAKRMGKRETEVSRWLGGGHNFTLSTLAKISDALGCNIIEVSLPRKS